MSRQSPSAKHASEAVQLPAVATLTSRPAAVPADIAPFDPLSGLSRANREYTEGKLEIAVLLDAFKKKSCRPPGAALQLFVSYYNSGETQVSAATRKLFPRIAGPTLLRDWRRWRKHGVGALILGYGNRSGDSMFSHVPAMRELVSAVLRKNPGVRAPWLRDAIQTRFPREHLPSLSSVKRELRAQKRSSLYLNVSDPDGWKNRHMLALGDADADITRVNQLWEIDGTKSDAFVWTEVETKTGKMQMIGVIDVFSRRKVALLAPSESSQAVADLLIKAFRSLGIPDEIKSDRGKAFLSERTQRGIFRVGLKWTVVPAYSGWKKPFVERGSMGSVLHMFFENLPGYSGHSPAEASAIRKRRSFAERRGQDLAKLYRVELTADALQTLLDQYLECVDGEREQAGRKPNDVLAEAERCGQVRRVADDRVLDLLLAEDGFATVGKKGVRAKNVFYWTDELIDYIGRKVQYVFTRDQGRLIIYSTDDAPKYVGTAVNLEMVGIDRHVVAVAAKARQRAVMHAGRKELDALVKKHRPETLAVEIIDNSVARKAAQLPAQSNMGTLPHRGGTVPAAMAALEALDTPAQPAPKYDAEQLEEGRAIVNRLSHRPLDDREDDESDWQRFKRLRVLAEISDDDRNWMRSFQGTSVYRGRMLLENARRPRRRDEKVKTDA